MTACTITKFAEHDIDLLMAEELSVNPAFCAWLMDLFDISDQLEFPAAGANISVVEDGSEADVLVDFARMGGGCHRLFVEDKIDASMMPEQLERYVQRAEGDIRKGVCVSTSILFFTPAAYHIVALPEGVLHLTFEALAEALPVISPGPRAEYRASFLLAARPLGSSAARDQQVGEQAPYIRDWWDAVYAALEKAWPGFFLHRTKYPRSVYFAPSMAGQAKYLRVDFKGHKGEVDLAFKNVPFDILAKTVAVLDQPPGHLVENGVSSAIQISGLPKFVISDGFSVIESRVLGLYRATKELLQYWQSNRRAFDQMVAQVKSGDG